MKNKIIFKSLTKIIFIFLLAVGVGFGQFYQSGAWFSSSITGANNDVESSVLDLTVRSGQTNFVSSSVDVHKMKPGESVARDIYVGKTSPSLGLKHKVSFAYVSGDQDLCGQLQLKLWYDHYHCDPSLGYAACRDMRLTYTGPLSDLDNYENTDFLIPHPDDQFDSDPSDGTEQWFYYSLSLPSDSADTYQGETCQFNFVYQAWQENSDGTWGFTDEETLGGNDIGSGDWTPSSAPTGLTIYKGHDPATRVLVGCGGYTNDTNITIDWEANPELDIAYYWFGTQFNPHHAKVYPPNSEYQGNMTPGHNPYYYTVSAVDTAGNESTATEKCYLTLDQSTPTTTFYTSNSPEREIKDDVLNGDFDDGADGLDNWTSTGNVEVVEQESFTTDSGDVIIDPNDILDSSPNPHMVVIKPSDDLSGVDPDSQDNLYYSMLSQEIDNSAKTLSFWYNFATYDSIESDNPGFSVYLNNQEIYQKWAEDINYPGGDLAVSGWKKFYYDLSSIDMGTNPVLTLIFYSGNKGDNSFDSWIYLDKISTNDVVVNSQTKFYLESSSSLSPAHTYFKLGACDSEALENEFNQTNYPDGYFTINETNAPLDNKFCYWTEDEAGNKEQEQEIILIYDNNKPDSIDDLQVTDLGGGDFTLDWTAVDPNDPITGNHTSAGYLVKYSTSPITDDDTFNSADSSLSNSPRSAGEDEVLNVKGLNPNTTYYFSVKAVDAAGNKSDLDPDGGSVDTNGSLVVLNEIMYNPLGDENGTMPNGEWVELYNNADYDIDVAGWTIKDVVGYTSSHDITISTSNSDNDLDTSDGGETIVPANGWLVVYRNGSAIFNDTGDTVQLYDNFNNLIDSHTYSSGKVKGTSEARDPDGTGAWADPLPTPGRKNVLEQSQLEPQVKIYQQDANNSKIGIFDALNYHQAQCDVYYFHQEEGMVEPIQENVKKETTINGLETFITDIYMGTESKGVYTPHHNITNVSLECVLSGDSIPDRTLTANLEGSWTQ